MSRLQGAFGIVSVIVLALAVMAATSSPMSKELGTYGVAQLLVVTALKAWMVILGWRLLGHYARCDHFSEEVAGLYEELFKAQLLVIAFGVVQLKRRGVELQVSTQPWFLAAAFWTWGVVTRAGLQGRAAAESVEGTAVAVSVDGPPLAASAEVSEEESWGSRLLRVLVKDGLTLFVLLVVVVVLWALGQT